MSSEERSFATDEVVRITGVQYSTLNHWVKKGLIKASIAPARGSGSRRLYSFQDLVAIRVALKLRQAGIRGKAIPQILGVLREVGFGSNAAVMVDVRTDGEVIVAGNKGVKISARKRPGQLFLNWDCSGAEAEVRSMLGDESLGKVRKAAKSESDCFVGRRRDRERRA